LALVPANMDKSKQLEAVMDWVTTRLAVSDVPRFSDVINHAQTEMGFSDLKGTAIARQLRLHPAYLMNSQQKKGSKRWGNFRPIVVNQLGSLHADLGYFSPKRGIETPPDYRSGFLVAKDILSRYVYVIIITKNKSADSMIRAFTKLLKKHEEVYGPEGHKIQSIGFDRETSVMSNKVQAFLRDQGIKFHSFEMSSSKAKGAERAIGQIRTIKDRLERAAGKQLGWWRVLQTCADILNGQEIRVPSHRRLGYAPKDINQTNVKDFLERLYKADPAVYYNQFELAPELVNFKFPVGTFVRPKLLVTSSAVIGVKRSEVTLEDTVYAIVQQVPYTTHGHFVGKAYKCENLRNSSTQIFDEHDLAETVAE